MKNLDCTDIKALLSGLVDDQLDGPTRHEAERHLAGCKPCRDMLTEAEGVTALLALEARLLEPRALPEDFEAAVLSRTVYAEAYQYAGRSWTSWLGWVAAAACLGLATSIWFLDLRRADVASNTLVPRPVDQLPAPNVIAYEDHSQRSWTTDGGLPSEMVLNSAPRHPDHAERNSVLALSLAGLRKGNEAVFEQPAIARDAATLEQLSAQPTLSRDDAQTLASAAMLLEMLSESPLTSFADVERIRQIAEYDEVLERLAETRARLSPRDRPAIMAAESVLLRIVRGPLDLNDLRILHDTVATLDLSTQVGAISERWQPVESL